MTRVTVQQAGELDRDEFVRRFGPLYEHSPWVAEGAWRRRPFDGIEGLHAALDAVVAEAPLERRLALIRAHPELAGREAAQGELTEGSASEQASAGLDRLSADELSRLRRLNASYREAFGFPMVVAVREHTKQSIFAQAEARLAHARDEEVATALREVSKIARMRLDELVAHDDGGTAVSTVSSTGAATGTGRIVLGQNNYGKGEVKLLKVFKGPDRHGVRDIRADISLEGDFEAAHVEGDNTGLLATDTMRNTVYALALEHFTADLESFGLVLVNRFLEAGPSVTGARVRLTEYPYERLTAGGGEHPHGFQRGSGGNRVAVVTGTAQGAQIEAGIEDLLVLKSTGSGWAGFLREEYTSLPETSDRIMATIVTASWAYEGGGHDFDRLFASVRDTVLRVFDDHFSPSVQRTLYLMGHAALEAHPEVKRIRFSLPNKHHLLYDLSRFGMQNDNVIFHVTNEPYGLIEGTVERGA